MGNVGDEVLPGTLPLSLPFEPFHELTEAKAKSQTDLSDLEEVKPPFSHFVLRHEGLRAPQPSSQLSLGDAGLLTNIFHQLKQPILL
jgi:hypothetical protein